jgi:uncharacterized UPF0160 family protein
MLKSYFVDSAININSSIRFLLTTRHFAVTYLSLISTNMSKTIGTHDGKFHCDEVLACWMLKNLANFEKHVIVRSRDPAILETCDIVVDVGGVYSHEKRRYDHHQRTFNDTMRTLTGLQFDTRLSSAGLIYVHYGKAVIAKLLEISENDPSVDTIYVKLYQNFVESVDGIDNGVQQFDGIPRYQLACTLSSLVGNCNPAWNESNANTDDCFMKAFKIVGQEFEKRVNYMYKSWLPARQFVQKAVEKRVQVHESGKILELEPKGLPWKEHFFEFEKQLGLTDADICLVIYEDDNGSWRVQSIPVSETSGFENRVPLPWKGYRDKDLAEISGIEGAIFVHVTGFIGGAQTREGALKMAVEALRQANKI